MTSRAFFVPFLSFRRSSRPSAAGQHSCAPTPGGPPPAGGGVQSPAAPFYTHKYEVGKAPLRRSSKSVQRAQALDLRQLDDIPEAFPRVTSIRAATGEAVERSEQSEQSELSGKAREGASGRMRSRRGKPRRRTPLAGGGWHAPAKALQEPCKAPCEAIDGRHDPGGRGRRLRGPYRRGAAVGGMGASQAYAPCGPCAALGGLKVLNVLNALTRGGVFRGQ